MREAAADGSPTITPPKFSLSSLKRTRVEDSDEECEADAPIGPVDINTATPVGQSAWNEVDVVVFDKDRVTRALPKKINQVTVATIPCRTNIAAAVAPATLDENGEVNPFAATS